jgi:hypothetical protein
MKQLLLVSLVLITQASLAQTRVGMYYVSGKPGQHGMWFTEQNANGSWQRGNKVLLNGLFDGDAVDPEILPQANGSYRMYYFKGNFVTPPPANPGLNKIYLAESTDALQYNVIGEAFAYQNIFDPSVVKLNNGDYLMACTQAVGNVVNTVLAKSTNGGITFVYQSTLNNTGVPELFVLNDGSVRLFYNGIGGIVSQKSTDHGNSWQLETGFRLSVPGFAGDPSVVQIDANTWWLFVKGFNGNGSQGLTSHKVMLAQSTNETNSFTLLQNLVLDSASVPEGVVMHLSTAVGPDASAAAGFKLYPNPAQDQVLLQSTQALHNATLRLYDSKGLCVLSMAHVEGRQCELPLHELPAGLYWVVLQDCPQHFPAQKLLVLPERP